MIYYSAAKRLCDHAQLMLMPLCALMCVLVYQKCVRVCIYVCNPV